jgi:hypothetical protein
MSVRSVRPQVLRKLITLQEALYQQYQIYDWCGSKQHPSFSNYVHQVVNEEDVQAILQCSPRSACDYLMALRYFVV